MLPHIHILGIHVPMYSLMVALGAVFFLIYFKFNIEKREKIDRITANRLIFVSILGFVTLGVSAFIFNSFFHSIEEGKIVVGGITWLGGVIGLIPAVIYLIHVLVPKEKGNALNRLSSLFPGLVIAHAFGRLGCFFGGCCYGGVTDSIFGVSFPAGSLAGRQYPNLDAPTADTIVNKVTNDAGETIEQILYPSLPVFPTQLVEALFEILLFAFMIIFYKKFKNHNIEIYGFVYGTFRFVLEFWRGDDRGSTGFALSPSQIMSLIIFIFAILLVLYKKGIIGKKYAKMCEVWQSEAKAKPASNGVSIPIFSQATKTADAIRELHKLKQEGILDEDEYKEKKAELMKRL